MDDGSLALCLGSGGAGSGVGAFKGFLREMLGSAEVCPLYSVKVTFYYVLDRK